MAYVLAEITPEDQERIIQDAASDPGTQKHLSFARSCNAFAKTWAVDKERGCYLLFAPRLVREDSETQPFYIRVHGALYRIECDGLPFIRMRFSDKRLPVSLLHEMLDEIKAAVAVYGQWGEGPLNSRGEPQYELPPKFITVADA
jgi:hypothetical protein